LLRLTAIDDEVVEGSFLNPPGAFMPMRTRLNSPHRNGEAWAQVFDHCNPQRGTTAVNPGLIADHSSLRFMAQLHLAGRQLRGFLRPLNGAELSGRCTDGSWFTAGFAPDDDGLFPVAQGGPQRLWDTVESCYAAWRRLGEPNVEGFGVTAYHDVQNVWLNHPNSHYRWPLPL
jgi:hypothetical protein